MSSSGPWIRELGLAAILRQLPVAVVVVEAGSLRIVEFNDRARDMAERQLGESVPEALGDWWEIFHPDGRPYALEERPVVRSMISGDEVDGEEYFSVLPDGSRMIVRSSSAPLYDDRGAIAAGVLVMEDVTAQRQVEEQLAYHARLVESMEDGVIATDARFVVTAWNRAAERLYGWSADEVLGRHVRDVLQTRLSDKELDARFSGVAEEGRARSELVVYGKDGNAIEVEFITAAIRGERGEAIGYLAIHRGVSERKSAERTLREANRRSERILESIGELFFAMDGEWRITYMNQRALANSRKARGEDLSLDDVLGKIYWEVFPEAVGTVIDREFHRAVRDQELIGFEVVGPLSGVWFDICASAADHGLSVYSRDITERKEAERRVAEAREAERARITRALHDEALQGLADVIALVALGDKSPPEQRLAGQLLPALQRVGQQLRRTIYDLRLEAEQSPFVELVEQLVDEHRAMAADSDMEVQMGDGVPPGSLGAKGIEVLLILGEALTNARRHADARHIRVRVWGANERLWTEVSDDGLGFDTTDPAPLLHHGIRGMHERARLLGGDLKLDSEPRVGTTVRWEVNLTDAETADA